MDTARRILFIGLHPTTPMALDCAPLEVAAVAHLDYFWRITLHPAHVVFQVCYALCSSSTSRTLRYPASVAWKLAKPYARGTYARYAEYLSWLLSSTAEVISAEDTSSLISFVAQHDIELIVVNSWSILPEEVLRAPRTGAINVHPSKLPQYRGAVPTLWSLKQHDTHSALTFLVMGRGVDDGALIAQHAFEIPSTASSIDIEHTIDTLIASHLHRDTVSYLNHAVELRQQVGTPSSTARYEAYRTIQWHKETARDIVNKILLYPFVEPFLFCITALNGAQIEIRDADMRPWSNIPAGQFLVEKLSVHIGTADGVVSCQLFRDIGFASSLRLLYMRSGTLD
jgi:methionyl-tRNA formyltransferase